MQSPYTTVKMASGKPVNIQHQAKVQFFIGNTEFENSLVLPKMNHMLLGYSFFKHYNIDISPGSALLKLPDFTFQLNELKPKLKNPSEKAKKDYPLVASKKTVIQPFQQDTIECFVQNQNTEIADVTGIVTPNENFEQKRDLLAMSSINQLDKTLIVKVSVFNPNDRAVTICKDTEIAKFKLFTPRQAQFLQPLDLRLISLAKMRNSKNFEQELNQLLQVSTVNGESQPDRPPPEFNKLWSPTPET